MYLDTPGCNPGPGPQITARPVFVLLVSAVVENTCLVSDDAGACTT